MQIYYIIMFPYIRQCIVIQFPQSIIPMLTNRSYKHRPYLTATLPSISIDDDPFDHINPLYRPKDPYKKSHKQKEKFRKLSYTGSGDNFSNFIDTLSSTLKKPQTDTDDKLKVILEKVQKNEKNIEKLMKEKHSLQMDRREKKIQKQIRDIFMFIRDHKYLQNKVNENIHDQLSNLKYKIIQLQQEISSRLDSSFMSSLKQVPKIQQKVSILANFNSDIKQKIQKLTLELNNDKLLKKKWKISQIYCSKPVALSISEKLKQKDIQLNQITYYVDEEGYLLDGNFYYLLTEENQQIQINQAVKKTLPLHFHSQGVKDK